MKCRPRSEYLQISGPACVPNSEPRFRLLPFPAAAGSHLAVESLVARRSMRACGHVMPGVTRCTACPPSPHGFRRGPGDRQDERRIRVRGAAGAVRRLAGLSGWPGCGAHGGSHRRLCAAAPPPPPPPTHTHTHTPTHPAHIPRPGSASELPTWTASEPVPAFTRTRQLTPSRRNRHSVPLQSTLRIPEAVKVLRLVSLRSGLVAEIPPPPPGVFYAYAPGRRGALRRLLSDTDPGPGPTAPRGTRTQMASACMLRLLSDAGGQHRDHRNCGTGHDCGDRSSF